MIDCVLDRLFEKLVALFYLCHGSMLCISCFCYIFRQTSRFGTLHSRPKQCKHVLDFSWNPSWNLLEICSVKFVDTLKLICGDVGEQTKKGVKRKADTTTPAAAVIRTSPYDTPFDSSPTPTVTKSSSSASKDVAKSTKKSRKDSTDGATTTESRTPASATATAAASGGSKQTPALEFCKEILKELFGKRHAVSQSVITNTWLFCMSIPVLGCHLEKTFDEPHSYVCHSVRCGLGSIAQWAHFISWLSVIKGNWTRVVLFCCFFVQFAFVSCIKFVYFPVLFCLSVINTS